MSTGLNRLSGFAAKPRLIVDFTTKPPRGILIFAHLDPGQRAMRNTDHRWAAMPGQPEGAGTAGRGSPGFFGSHGADGRHREPSCARHSDRKPKRPPEKHALRVRPRYNSWAGFCLSLCDCRFRMNCFLRDSRNVGGDLALLIPELPATSRRPPEPGFRTSTYKGYCGNKQTVKAASCLLFHEESMAGDSW